MTEPIGLWRATYTPGTWVVLSGPTSLVILQPAPARVSTMINSFWDVVVQADSLDTLVAELARYNVERMPDFAAFFWHDGRMRSLVRGALEVIDIDSGNAIAAGEGLQTWAETDHGEVRRFRVEMEDVNTDELLQLPLVVGAANASVVHLDATDEVRVSSPQEMPAASSTSPRDDAGDSGGDERSSEDAVASLLAGSDQSADPGERTEDMEPVSLRRGQPEPRGGFAARRAEDAEPEQGQPEPAISRVPVFGENQGAAALGAAGAGFAAGAGAEFGQGAGAASAAGSAASAASATPPPRPSTPPAPNPFGQPQGGFSFGGGYAEQPGQSGPPGQQPGAGGQPGGQQAYAPGGPGQGGPGQGGPGQPYPPGFAPQSRPGQQQPGQASYPPGFMNQQPGGPGAPGGPGGFGPGQGGGPSGQPGQPSHQGAQQDQWAPQSGGVDRGREASAGGPGGPGGSGGEAMILGVTCAMDHANPPDAQRCRRCGGPLQGQPRLMPRPVMGLLRPSTGQPVEIDRSVLIGRSPQATQVARDQLPRLLTVPSPSHDISRTHVQVSPDGWELLATDLHSTNGTQLIRPGQPEPERLLPGEPVPVFPGCVLDLGDGVTILIDHP